MGLAASEAVPRLEAPAFFARRIPAAPFSLKGEPLLEMMPLPLPDKTDCGEFISFHILIICRLYTLMGDYGPIPGFYKIRF